MLLLFLPQGKTVLPNKVDWIWIRRHPPRFTRVQWRPRIYDFNVQHGISLGQVHPDDADGILNHRMGCCGNRRKVFWKATPGDQAKWMGGI